MDYYAALGITADADDRTIAQAYRRLALQYHPRLAKLDRTTAVRQFSLVSEAFEVLSDPERRAFYDKYGEYLLKTGIPTEDGLAGGYQFHGQPELVFEKFFGSSNPYSQIYDQASSPESENILAYAYGESTSTCLNRPRILEVELPCTLEELF